MSEFDEIANRNHYENKSVEKQKILDDLKTIIIDSKGSLEGNSFYHHASLNLFQDLYAKQLNLFWCGKQASTKMCEIGFNAGHSSDTFLQHPSVHVTSFDLGIH